MYCKKRVTTHVIISLAKGVKAEFEPHPRIVTHAQMIYRAYRLIVRSVSKHHMSLLLPTASMASNLFFLRSVSPNNWIQMRRYGKKPPDAELQCHIVKA
ncbi:hypothetical protein N665_0117s0024 [Sinapis alba]|nr:hypothetical protein N665_0117s0024 [Sinapis alba]